MEQKKGNSKVMTRGKGGEERRKREGKQDERKRGRQQREKTVQ